MKTRAQLKTMEQYPCIVSQSKDAQAHTIATAETINSNSDASRWGVFILQQKNITWLCALNLSISCHYTHFYPDFPLIYNHPLQLKQIETADIVLFRYVQRQVYIESWGQFYE